jgi:hypothetical protein
VGIVANPLWEHPGLVIALQLIIWSVVWLVAAVIGLWRTKREVWRGFWFVTGIWCSIDAAIGIAGLMGTIAPLPDLRWLLLTNAGLDVLYVAVGVVLATRPRPVLRGAGWAVVIQGLFLLLFDFLHAMSIPLGP